MSKKQTARLVVMGVGGTFLLLGSVVALAGSRNAVTATAAITPGLVLIFLSVGVFWLLVSDALVALDTGFTLFDAFLHFFPRTTALFMEIHCFVSMAVAAFSAVGG